MQCNQCQEFVGAFIDGEVSPGQYTDIQTHIKECVACRNLMEQNAAVKSLVQSKLPVSSAPADLRQRILQQIEDTPAERFLWKPRRIAIPYRSGIVFAVAALLMLAVIGIYAQWTPARQIVTSPDAQPGSFQQVSAVQLGSNLVRQEPNGYVLLQGRLVCVGCELTASQNIIVNCEKYGHQAVLELDSGLYVSFTLNDICERINKDHTLIGRQVQVLGKLHRNNTYIDIESYQKIS